MKAFTIDLEDEETLENGQHVIYPYIEAEEFDHINLSGVAHKKLGIPLGKDYRENARNPRSYFFFDDTAGMLDENLRAEYINPRHLRDKGDYLIGIVTDKANSADNNYAMVYVPSEDPNSEIRVENAGDLRKQGLLSFGVIKNESDSCHTQTFVIFMSEGTQYNIEYTNTVLKRRFKLTCIYDNGTIITLKHEGVSPNDDKPTLGTFQDFLEAKSSDVSPARIISRPGQDDSDQPRKPTTLNLEPLKKLSSN